MGHKLKMPVGRSCCELPATMGPSMSAIPSPTVIMFIADGIDSNGTISACTLGVNEYGPIVSPSMHENAKH